MSVILEPGFETVTNWVYAEVDSHGNYTGYQDTTWKTEGIYSYRLNAYEINYPLSETGDYAEVKQTITIPTGGFYILFDAKCYGLGSIMKFQVLIDSTVVWEVIPDWTEQVFLNQVLNLSAYSGTKTIRFRMLFTSGATSSDTFYFNIDNIREGANDIYVNSSTGNDANAGDSCVAGHPKLTFAAAYALLASGGTIHVCNTGADFSAETVTLNKSFSIDLNGADGYFYMPQAS